MESVNPEPEGGGIKHSGNKITTIKAQSNSGGYWPVRLEHNGIEYLIPKDGLKIHINGGAVRINGIEVTRKIQKGVENTLRHDSWTGKITNITKE